VNSRDTENWPKGEKFAEGKKVKFTPLVDPDKLSYLHFTSYIILHIMKNSVTA
jgi:hypothetical protein